MLPSLLRAPMQTDDIEGSRPQRMKQFGPQLSNPLELGDIEGTAVGWRPRQL